MQLASQIAIYNLATYNLSSQLAFALLESIFLFFSQLPLLAKNQRLETSYLLSHQLKKQNILTFFYLLNPFLNIHNIFNLLLSSALFQCSGLNVQAFNFCPQRAFLLIRLLHTNLSLERFKIRIKTWTTDKCPCRICKIYIGQIGFI